MARVMRVKRFGKFLINGLILAGMAVLMRAVALAFNVYISNRIGADGVGLFGLLLSVSGLAVTVAVSGVGIAATRSVARQLALGQAGDPRRAARTCVLYALGTGTAAMVLLLVFAERIGTDWLKDVRTVSSLRVLACSMPFTGVVAAVDGYFTAVRRVFKSAIAQLCEQAVRLAVTVALLNWAAPYGLEYACMAIVGGITAGEVLHCAVNGLLYWWDRRKLARRPEAAYRPREALEIAVPVALAAYARSAILTLKNLMVPGALQQYGCTRSEALADYGRVSGMALPAVLFPHAFVSAFSGLLVPELTEFDVKGDRAGIHRVMTRVFSGVFAFSIGMGAAFALFGRQLGAALYEDGSAGRYIVLLAPLVPVMYVDSAVDGMLKGLNEHRAVMVTNLINSALTLLFVWVLLPRCGVMGYVVVLYLSELIDLVMSLARLLSVTGYRGDWKRLLGRPLLAAAASGVGCLVFAQIAKAPLGPTAGLALWGSLFGLSYLLIWTGLQERQPVRERL